MIADNADHANIVVMQSTKYCSFELIKNGIPWKIERIIWIAFYKNNTNRKCLLKLLPKDIVKVIVDLLSKTLLGQEFVKEKSICL